MKTKNFSLRILSLLLSLLLLLTAVPMAGMLSVSAGVTGLDVYVVGTMTGWGSREEYKFVEEGNGIYSYVWDMTGGVYECKIFTGDWSTSIGSNTNDDDNIIFDIKTDTIMKITANVNNRSYTAVEMDSKSDFTLGNSATTIEAEKYTYALGEVTVLSDTKASSGKYVGNFDVGDSLNFGVTVSGKEPVTYRFDINVASETDDGMMYFVVRSTSEDGVFEKIIGKDSSDVNFTTTGGWQNYKTVSVTTTLNPGYNRITLENVFGTYNVDKLVVTPAKDAADVITKGKTTLDFKGFDAISDTSLVKNGKFAGSEGEYTSLIVKPEQDGVYTLKFEDSVVKSDNLMVFSSDFRNFAIISEEVPQVDFVIDGETEIFFNVMQDTLSINNVSFEYIESIEQMGYLFYTEDYTGYRFANTFAINDVTITSFDAIQKGKLIFSDGTYVDADAIGENETKTVVLPEIIPGVITGLLFAFTLSIDDFVISFFTTGNGVSNLSIYVYSMARRGLNPKINALSTIMFVVVVSLLLFINKRTSKDKSKNVLMS